MSTEELMPLNGGVEKTLESPLDCKEMQSMGLQRVNTTELLN